MAPLDTGSEPRPSQISLCVREADIGIKPVPLEERKFLYIMRRRAAKMNWMPAIGDGTGAVMLQVLVEYGVEKGKGGERCAAVERVTMERETARQKRVAALVVWFKTARPASTFRRPFSFCISSLLFTWCQRGAGLMPRERHSISCLTLIKAYLRQ